MAKDFDALLAAEGHIRAGHRIEPYLLALKGGKQAESLSSALLYAQFTLRPQARLLLK